MRISFWNTTWFRVTFGTTISLLFLYLALKDVPLDEVWLALARANYVWVALAVVTMVAQSSLRAVRWIVLFYPLHKGLRVGQMLGIILIAQMLNIVVPWRVGELARIYLAGEIARRSKTQTLATLGVEKFFDTTMLLVILLIIPLFMTLPTWLEGPREGIVVLSVALFVAMLALIFSKDWLVRFASVRRWHRGGSDKTMEGERLRLLGRISLPWRGYALDTHAQLALGSLDVFKRWDTHLELQALSLGIWCLGVVVNYLTFLALNLQLPFVSALLLLAVLQVGGLVPTSPGKVGVFQYLCILTLALFAVDKSVGLTYGILLYFVAYGTPVVLGILFMWWGGVNLRRVAHEPM